MTISADLLVFCVGYHMLPDALRKKWKRSSQTTWKKHCSCVLQWRLKARLPCSQTVFFSNGNSAYWPMWSCAGLLVEQVNIPHTALSDFSLLDLDLLSSLWARVSYRSLFLLYGIDMQLTAALQNCFWELKCALCMHPVSLVTSLIIHSTHCFSLVIFILNRE